MSMLSAQDLGIAYVGDVSDLQRATTQAGSVVDGFARKAKGDLKGVSDEAKRTDDGFTRLANGIRSAFVGSSVAVGLITLKNQLVAVTGALTDAQVQLDRLTNGFRFGAGSAEAGAREMAFVRSEADRLGLSLGSTATQYMKMVAASRGSTLAGEKTRDLFRSISEASMVMGMGQEQTERAMAAVVQMMSKGKVMAEELRGQLGEHLPGAFSIAARAMGVTEIELNKLMETGSVLSEDFLPKFAAQLRKELAGSVEQSTLSMQASLNRLSTAWLEFKQQIAQGGAGEAISSGTRMLANDLTAVGDALEASRVRGEGAFMQLANAAGVVAGRSAFGFLADSAEFVNGTINVLSGGMLNLSTNIDLIPDNLKPMAVQLDLTAQKVRQAEAEYATLAARLAQVPDNIYIKSELNNLARYIATLRIAQQEQRALMGGGGSASVVGSVGSGDAALARANRAQYDRQKAAADAAMRKYATPTEKRDEEVKAMKAALGDLYTPELEKRINDNYIKPSKEGAKAAKAAAKEAKDFADVYSKVLAKDSGLSPSFYKDLDTLHDGYKKGRIDIDEYRTAVEALITNQKFATDAVKAETDARIAAGVANNAAFDAEFDSIEKKRLANEAQIKTGREMLEQIQFETSLIGLNTLEREQATAMRELERAGVVKGTQAYEAYAEAIKKAMADRDAQQKTLDFWKELDRTASSVFIDLAMNGEDAFKRLGESLKREVIQLLYEMTIKKWIFQIAGVSGGAGGGTNWIDMAQQAYKAYSSGGAAAASSGAGASAGSGGAAAAAASAYGTTGTAGSAGGAAAGTASTAGTAGTTAASTSWMTYAGYAAFIAAAVMIAENLYEKGYNRKALGEGGRETVGFGQYSSFTTDPSVQRSWMNNGILNLEARNQRTLMDAVGMNEKWADIFSGTTRMATLIGRKLKAYGFEASIAGGDAEVDGYAKYKGGLFRSNKTVRADVDPRDAAAFDAVVESTIEGSRAMARAMGYSGEAIDAYTGKIRVNFKNAKTAEEQAERMAEAMDDLNYALLKTASGGKLARDEFKSFMESVQKDIEAAGISTDGITNILASGIVDGASAAQIGEQLSTMILGGIYNTLAQNAFGPVAAAISAQLITPIFTAMAAGVPVSQVISKQAIANIVATAQAAAAALNEVFANAEFQAAMAGIETAIKGAAGAAASVKVPKFRSSGVSSYNAAAAEQARAAKAIKDTWTDVTDSILEQMNRIRRSILGETEVGRAFAQAQFMIATAQARAGDQGAAERLPELSQAAIELAEATATSAGDLRAVQGTILASLAETRKILGARYGISLPAFDVGTNYVPHDMIAQIHRGEAIVPAAYNPAAGGFGNNAELLVEIKAMRAELTALKLSNLVAAGSATRLERIMETVTNGGNMTRVQVVA